jgi:hypothetical protein
MDKNIPSPSTRVRGITLNEVEVEALLYGAPTDEFSEALKKLAAWLGEVTE